MYYSRNHYLNIFCMIARPKYFSQQKIAITITSQIIPITAITTGFIVKLSETTLNAWVGIFSYHCPANGCGNFADILYHGSEPFRLE